MATREHSDPTAGADSSHNSARAAAAAYVAPSDADLIRWFGALTPADRRDIYREAAGMLDAPTDAAPDPWTPDHPRIGFAIDALAQADALLEIVRGQLPNEFHTNALAGLLVRVEQLHDAAAAAITDEAETATKLDRVIFGRPLPTVSAAAEGRTS